MALAARAVIFISSMAHARSFSGLPLTSAGAKASKPLVVGVADALAGEVGAERPAVEIVFFEMMLFS